MANIDNINFSVIIDDKEFNKKIADMEATAKNFNTNLTDALKIQGEIIDTDMIRAISKTISDMAEGYKKMAQESKDSADIETKSLEQTAEAVRKVADAKKLAAKAQADMVTGSQLSRGETMGNMAGNIANPQKKLDLTIQINQQVERLRQLEDEINVIQEIRQERGGGLSEEYKKAVKEAEKVQNVIKTLKQTQDSLNMKQPNYGEQAKALSQQSITLKQMAAEYSIMEKKSKEAAESQAEAAKEAEKAAKETAREQAKAAKEAERQTKATQKSSESAKVMAEETKKTSTQLSLANRSVNQFASILRGSVSIYAVKRIMESIITITGEFELQRTTLRAILQDVNKADAIFSQIKDLALVSPFNFKDLISYTKQLSAFSVPAEELYDTTKMLADMSAGLGVGMDRLILAYGQVRSASFLRGQEVRQFTEAGVPILEALKNEFVALGEEGITVGQVFDKISTRQVPFEMVKKVLEDMAKEGGKFFNMQEIQSATLKGKLSNLKDAYQLFLNDVGSGMDGFLKGSVDLLRKMMENYKEIGRVLIDLITIYGTYKTAAMLVNISDQIAKYGSLGKAIKSLTNAQKLLNSALLTNPYIFAATAITALITLFIRARKEANRLNNDLLSITNNKMSSAQGLIDDFDALCDRLKKAKVGTQEYRDSIRVLNNQYEEYLPNVLTEKNAIDELATSYTAVTESIYNKAKAEASTEGIKKIRDNYSEASQNYTELFISKLSGKGLSRKDIAEMLKLYNDELKKQTGAYNPTELFNEVYKLYTKSDKGIFEGFTDVLNDIKQSTPFIRNIVGVNTTGWQTARDALWNYSTIFSQQANAEKNFSEWLDVNYSATAYKTQEEKQKVEELNSKYDELFKNLHNNEKLSASEFQDAQFNLDVKKLEGLLSIYKQLGRGDEVAKIQGQIDKLTKSTEGWAGEVQKVLMSMDMKGGKSGGLWVDDTTVRTEYIKKLREEYAGWEQEYTDSQKKDKDYLLNRKKAMEAIFNVMGVSPITLKTTTGGSGKSKAEKDLEAQAASIKKVKDAYDTLSPYLTGSGMTGALKTLFPSVDESIINNIESYRKLIEDVADLLDKVGDESSKKAAENLRLSVGGNEAKDMADKLKAAQEYSDMMRKWLGEDFNLQGTGIGFDVSKIASDLNSAYEGVTQKRDNAYKKLHEAESKYTDEQYAYEQRLISDTYDKEMGYEKKLAQEKINNLAETYVKEKLFEKGIDMRDFADKTVSQISGMKEKIILLIDEIRTYGLDIDMSQIDIAELKVDDLTNKILSLLNTKGKNVAVEEVKKISNYAKEASHTIGELGSSFSQLGEDIGNESVKSLGEMMTFLTKISDIVLECDSLINGMANGFNEVADEMNNVADNGDKVAEEVGNIGKSSDWITMIVKVAILAIQKTIETISEYIQSVKESERSTYNFVESLRQLAIEAKLDGDEFDTIFGTDSIGKMRSNLAALGDAAKNYKETISSISNKALYNGDKKWWQGLGNIFVGAPTVAGLATPVSGGIGTVAATDPWVQTGAAIANVIKNTNEASDAYKMYIEGINKGYTDIQSMVIQTANVGWFGEIFGFKDKYKNLGDLAPELFDDKGNLIMNSKSISAWYDEWKDKLTEEQQALFEKLISNVKMTEEAIAGVTDYLEGIFGNLADDIADKMINAFVATGNAAVELGDIVSDVATQMAKDLIKSILIGNVLPPYIEKIKALYVDKNGNPVDMDEKERTKLALNIVDAAMGAVNKSAGDLNEVLQYINDKYGLTSPNDSNGGNMISGVTEETAQLLASYINAMRAELMRQGLKIDNIDMNVMLISAWFTSLPNLGEYLAKIEAHTQNTAICTQAILERLDSVITSEGGRRSISVYE